ncbi:hypothetical protein PG991_015226 [Apiospora marii]|uniref:Uncharacterized protein n=1 Tax=Apiospora marii TaxID=335849 RepID=A0ABR1R126_9PEZI
MTRPTQYNAAHEANNPRSKRETSCLNQPPGANDLILESSVRDEQGSSTRSAATHFPLPPDRVLNPRAVEAQEVGQMLVEMRVEFDGLFTGIEQSRIVVPDSDSDSEADQEAEVNATVRFITSRASFECDVGREVLRTYHRKMEVGSLTPLNASRDLIKNAFGSNLCYACIILTSGWSNTLIMEEGLEDIRRQVKKEHANISEAKWASDEWRVTCMSNSIKCMTS